jgi:hypothetical protein
MDKTGQPTKRQRVAFICLGSKSIGRDIRETTSTCWRPRISASGGTDCEHDDGLALVKPEKLVYLTLLADTPAMGASGRVAGLHVLSCFSCRPIDLGV